MKTASWATTGKAWLGKAVQTAKQVRLKKLNGKKITTRLFIISAIITLFNVGAGAFIYTQNLSVANAVNESEKLSEAERNYQAVSGKLLKTMLRMIDAIENGTEEESAVAIKTELATIPSSLEQLNKQFEAMDIRYPAEENAQKYVNQIKVLDLAYTNLSTTSIDVNALTAEEKSLRVSDLISVYTIIIDFSKEAMEKKLSEDTQDTQKSLNKSVDSANIIILVNIILLAVLPAVMIFGITRSIKTGLSGIMKRIEAYRNNQFTELPKLQRADEFGDIDASLADMGSNLRETIKATIDVSGTVLGVSNQMTEKISSNRDASEQVKGQIEFGKTSLQAQYDDASSISAVTEQISASSEEIAASSEYINGDMLKMKQASLNGSEQMAGVVLKVNETAQQFDKLTAAFESMNERYGNVAKFLAGIQDINTQTNLLSLNASIESARAGEHGRGFAVVADEIRKMSGQTDAISKQITKELALIQADVAASGRTISQFSDVIKSTRETSETASETFQAIESQSGVLSDQMSEISTAISEITQGMTHIVTAVDKLLEKSTEVNGQMEGISGLSDTQNGISDELGELSKRLTESSEALKERASVFKI
ncbi:methyl-accepting chemotaxis protein [Paenibacillus sp. YIM B09110]|uniref:methyl-accepting chemotaxis protein n=1 Tax=Paenibacillus sp. YIM B09110 TaxID=3126102 RepID=UPI00301CAFC8